MVQLLEGQALVSAPRFAIYLGRKMRVLDYLGDNVWRLVDTDDTIRTCRTETVVFTNK